VVVYRWAPPAARAAASAAALAAALATKEKVFA
jgi:hypothetical protein